ncbi:hypothetical protein KA013_00795 [Patescibacteria group bacterium]|nr:hypothetical protein [Patescibacteria group bacterium]
MIKMTMLMKTKMIIAMVMLTMKSETTPIVTTITILNLKMMETTATQHRMQKMIAQTMKPTTRMCMQDD